MATRGAQPGNQNATSAAAKNPWKSAINRCIAQDDSSLAEEARRVRRAAEKLLDLAAAGEQWAVKELGERLDGKVPQGIVGADGGPVQVQDVPWLRGRSV